MNRSDGGSQKGNDLRFGQMRRKDRRASVSGFVGDIADGNLVVGGMVEDLSLGGFRLAQMPDFFKAEKHTYTVVLSGGGKHYRLTAKPCWRRDSSSEGQLEMGFKILDAPWEWIEMTTKEIPEFDYEEHFTSTH
jgi:hypothetical protein